MPFLPPNQPSQSIEATAVMQISNGLIDDEI